MAESKFSLIVDNQSNISKQAIVSIVHYEQNNDVFTVGNGFFINSTNSNYRFILTTAHNVTDYSISISNISDLRIASKLIVQTFYPVPEQFTNSSLKIVFIDYATDIAILRIPNSSQVQNQVSLNLGQSCYVGEEIYTTRYNYLTKNAEFMKGQILHTETQFGNGNIPTLISSDINLLNTNSGCPLLSAGNIVVGMVSFLFENNSNLTGAISIQLINLMVNYYFSNQNTSDNTLSYSGSGLGVYYQAVPQCSALSAISSKGFVVTESYNSMLRVNDIITKINGIELRDSLMHLIYHISNNTDVNVEYLRNNVRLNSNIKTVPLQLKVNELIPKSQTLFSSANFSVLEINNVIADDLEVKGKIKLSDRNQVLSLEDNYLSIKDAVCTIFDFRGYVSTAWLYRGKDDCIYVVSSQHSSTFFCYVLISNVNGSGNNHIFTCRPISLDKKGDMGIYDIKDHRGPNNKYPLNWPNHPTLEISDTIPKIGSPIFMLGYPNAKDYNSFCFGHIRENNYQTCFTPTSLCYNIAGSIGNSGSPVINMSNKVVGLFQSTYKGEQYRELSMGIRCDILSYFVKKSIDNFIGSNKSNTSYFQIFTKNYIPIVGPLTYYLPLTLEMISNIYNNPDFGGMGSAYVNGQKSLDGLMLLYDVYYTYYIVEKITYTDIYDVLKTITLSSCVDDKHSVWEIYYFGKPNSKVTVEFYKMETNEQVIQEYTLSTMPPEIDQILNTAMNVIPGQSMEDIERVRARAM